MKILMTTMSLDIGGAETHIVELACELARRGVDVTVASNGGVYVPVLQKAGIRHICVPLHTKNPLLAYKSYRILYREIKGGGYDIVHAHARIPSFVCGLLARRLHFRYVTTCHGVYVMNALWKVLADWGDRALAVSCDVKDYLIRCYGVPSGSIKITINGIDADGFSAYRGERAEVCGELGLDPRCRRRIIHICRIDRESSYVALMLCELMPAVRSRFPDAELIIVGSGSAFGLLSETADRINGQARAKVITLTGTRTDIPRLLSVGDVFCGVSRSALEAMAAGLPVILAGSPDYSQGYIGIFGADKLNLALETNFCCRGCPEVKPDPLLDDICSLFAMDSERLSECGEYNRHVVREYYPISRMADDAMEVYRSLTPYKPYRHGDVVISGYYGFGNTGDDSLLYAILSGLRRRDPDMRLTVLSKRPRETSGQYAVRAISRFNIFGIMSELSHAKLLISGSGNLIQNSTSTRSLIYYLAIIRAALKRGCKTMIYASGIGPLNGRWARDISRETLEAVDTITLRERASVNLLNEIGFDASRVTVTSDPAYLLEPESPEWVDYVMRREKIPDNFFVIALRSWDEVSPNFEEKIATAAADIQIKTGAQAVYAAMQPTTDLTVCRNVARHVGSRVLSVLSASELIGIFARARFVIGMRLHTLVYSAVAGTPFIGLAYDVKIRALAKEFGLPYYLDVKTVTAPQIVKTALSADASREKLIALIKTKVTKMRESALTDSALAMELLGGTGK